MTTSQWPTNNYTPQSERQQSTPKEPRVIVELVGLDHPDHPVNRAKRAAEAAQKAAEEAAAAKAAAAAQPAASAKKGKPRVRRRRTPRVVVNETTAERHQRLCTVCNHDDRDEIEQEFLSWIHPESIARFYGVEWRAIYRHAHATNLFPARERNLRFALGRMVELSSQVAPTMDGMLRTIRAFSSLDRNGRWTEIPTHVVVSSGAQLAHSQLTADSVKSLTLRSVLDATGKANEPAEVPANPVLIDDPTRIVVPSEYCEPRDPSSMPANRQ